MLALAGSAKHSIQIIELLEERQLSFSICLNKHEILTLCSFGLLFQNQDLEHGSKLRKDVQKQLQSMMSLLERDSAPGASQFRQLVEISGISITEPVPLDNLDQFWSTPANGRMSSPAKDGRCSPQKQMKSLASHFTAAAQKYVRQEPNDDRRATYPSVSYESRNGSQVSLSSSISAQSEPTRMCPPNQNPSPQLYNVRQPAPPHRLKNVEGHLQLPRNSSVPNLDYFPFAADVPQSTSGPPRKTTNNAQQSAQPTDWERLLGNMDNGQTNIYDNIYGGHSVDGLLDVPSLARADTHPGSSYNSLDMPPDTFVPWFNNAHATSQPTTATNGYVTAAAATSTGSAPSMASDGGTSKKSYAARLSVESLEELNSPFLDDFGPQEWGSVSTNSDGYIPGIVMVGEKHPDGGLPYPESKIEEVVGPGDANGSWWTWVAGTGEK